MAGKLVQVVRRQRGQRGMTTAEYAVGSVAVATGDRKSTRLNSSHRT